MSPATPSAGLSSTSDGASDGAWPARPRPSSFWDLSTWPLSSRIATALLTVGVLLLGVVAAAGVLQVQTRQSQNLVITDYYNALRLSQDYFIRMLDSETAVRGYALSGDPDTLQPLTEAEHPWSSPISGQVATMVPAKRSALIGLRQVEADSLAWYQQWAAPAIAQTRAGQRLSSASIELGKTLFDRVRADYNSYVTQVRSGRTAATNRLHTLTILLFAAVIVIALLALLGGLLLWHLINTWVTRPVQHLAAEARLVGAGDLDHVVTAIGPPEFILLGDDVEGMRQRLAAQISVVEEAGRQVDSARVTLEDQALELQRSNRELEQFAYVASHDLQEPLRKVASFCQMLERRYAGQLDERADQYIHFAVDGAKRMQQLINDLLEFSRVGRVSSARVEVSLMDCLRNALGNLETAMEESGAEVTWDELPQVLGEAALLTQLLQNLIGNAIKFRGEQPPRIRLTVRPDGDFWEFSCADNGIGIEPEYADRVFLIFQRLHPKEVYSGTGIGLAMCKKIVEYHGGRIWVEPTATPGTTLCWTLPTVVPATPEISQAGTATLQAGPATARIDTQAGADAAIATTAGPAESVGQL